MPRTSFAVPLAAACGLLLLVAAAAAGDSAATKLQQASRIPSDWSYVRAADKHLKIPVILHLAPSPGARAKLEATCDAVSNPDSAAYGQHLSQAEVAALVGEEQSVDAVTTYLSALSGVFGVHVCATRDCVSAWLHVSTAEAAFGVDLHLWRPARGGLLARSVEHYTLPAELQGHVAMVSGLSDMVAGRAFGRDGAHSRGLREMRETEAAALRQAPIEDAAAVASAPYPTPILALNSFTNTQLFFIVVAMCRNHDRSEPFCAAGPGADKIVSFKLRLCTSPLICDTDDVQPVQVMPQTNITNVFRYNGTALKPYTYYSSFSVATVHQSGNMSAWGSMKAATDPPAGFRGVLTTPLMDPAETAAYYGLGSLASRLATPLSGPSQSVAEFTKANNLLRSDLTLFQTMYGLPTDTEVTFTHAPMDPTVPGLESTMDIELLMGVAPAVPTTFALEANTSLPTLAGQWALEWAVQTNEDANPPLVASISYGLPEELLSAAFGSAEMYSSRFNHEALKMCARGLTVVFCSQDAGATDDGHGTSACEIQPVFPASSPYVTTVGATIQSTTAARRADGGYGEAAISLTTGGVFTSGGGFSDLPDCRMPDYQRDAVAKYMARGLLPPVGTYNSTGRAYPDVAAIGRNYAIVLNGFMAPIGDGTSSSTPVWAGVLSLINNKLIAANKPPLGFVNPLLYKLGSVEPDALYDVVLGSNYCGAFLCCPITDGFLAAPGWDPVTGLGSVGEFSKLAAAALAAAA